MYLCMLVCENLLYAGCICQVTPCGEGISKAVMALLCSSALSTLCNFWINAFLGSKQSNCQLHLCMALFSTLHPVASVYRSGTVRYVVHLLQSLIWVTIRNHFVVVTGVAIVIPKGAIPEGVKQEIYFKVCQDNNILPPLDKEKGIIWTCALIIFFFYC